MDIKNLFLFLNPVSYLLLFTIIFTITTSTLESGRQIVGQESSQSPVVRWLEER
jgi:hypothetical protein